jgi:transcription initiation factor TFIID subunit TAF12
MSKIAHAVPPQTIKNVVSESFKDEIDDSAAELLAELMDDMLESVVDWSIKVADCKGTNILNPDDVRFISSQEWGVSIKDAPSSDYKK